MACACSSFLTTLIPHHTSLSDTWYTCSYWQVLALLHGVPNSLLLEHITGGLHLLVSAGTRPRRVALADGSPVDLVVAAANRQRQAGEGAAGGVSAAKAPAAAGAPTAAAEGGAGAIESLLQPFPSELDLECGNEVWLSNLGSTRHYLYAIHLSEGFLFSPTLAAALYLLLLRLLARQYEAVTAMASLCVCDGALSPEERQIVQLLAQVRHLPTSPHVFPHLVSPPRISAPPRIPIHRPRPSLTPSSSRSPPRRTTTATLTHTPAGCTSPYTRCTHPSRRSSHGTFRWVHLPISPHSSHELT